MTVDAGPRTVSLPPGPRLPAIAQSLLLHRYRSTVLPYWRRRYGDAYTLRLVPKGRIGVVLSRPEDIRQALNGPDTVFHGGEGSRILQPVMGSRSVLLLDEDAHLQARRRMLPAFHGTALRGYAAMIEEVTAEQVAGWPVGRPFASHPQLNRLSLQVILRVVFGVAEGPRLDALRPLLSKILTVDGFTMLSWVYPRMRRFTRYKTFAQVLADADRLIHAEIADRRAEADLTDRPDVLSRLLVTAADQSDDWLRDQLVTLLLAGHETTATALAWTFHELARRPDVQARAQRAADEGDDAHLVAVVKEALRLRPVIYEVARMLTENTEIAGRLLPAGASVLPGIGLVQSDPAHWPDPAEFRPERFLSGQPANSTWLPFSAGVRRCLGAGFAEMEAVAVLREVLVSYDVRPAGSRKPEKTRSRNITLVPGRGARVVLRRRPGRQSPA